MNKIAFIFPGQGAQHAGMGKEFYDTVPVSRAVFDLASEAAGTDMAELCFSENDRLNVTKYTQMAMLTVSLAILEAVKKEGIYPAVTAGLSLGEYGALAASGVISYENAVKVIKQRGIFMQEAVPEGGAMAAILGADASVIEKICEETEGTVSIANYNCPGQIVITGEERAVSNACAAMKAAGVKRTVMLNVSGPFHSVMLAGAGDRLAEVLEPVEILDFQIPYVSNVTARYITEGSRVKELLKQQVSSPVKWQQSVEAMIADGVTSFVEIGPGRTLTSFIRKISRDVKVMNVEKPEDLIKAADICKNCL